jgi:hypothetical protein
MNRVTIQIRQEAPPPEATVLLHLGSADERAIRTKVANVVKNHDRWIDLFDVAGRFAISVYALIGIDERTVLDQMPHKEYGRSTVGAVLAAGFEMLPTSIAPLLHPDLQQLQRFHYSIMLAAKGLAVRLLEADDRAVAHAASVVEPEVRRLSALFSPAFPTNPR